MNFYKKLTIENNKKNFEKVVSLIKQDKIKFKYGEYIDNKVLCKINSILTLDDLQINFHACLNSNGNEINVSYKEKAYLRLLGCAQIDDISVIQIYLREQNKIIYYLAFHLDKDFDPITQNSNEIKSGIVEEEFKDTIIKWYPNVTLEHVKFSALIEQWQFSSNNNKRSLYIINHIGVPSKYKKCKKILYRGLKLSELAQKKLKMNLPIKLEDRYFSSWSESKSEALRFGHQGNVYVAGILMKYSPSPNEIMININAIADELNDKSLSFRYEEKEVILFDNPKNLIVYPDQVEYVVHTKEYKKIPEKVKYKEFLKRDLKAPTKDELPSRFGI